MYNRRVKNKRLMLLLPLLLAAVLFVPSNTVPSAHAQFTGLVCITSSTTATSCPTAPPSIGPIAVGSMFSVGVFVQNSDPLVGWDVYVAANSSILSPTSAALGNLVPNPSLTGICINGVAQTGSCTQGTANGPGVVEVTTIDSSGSNVCNNPPPGPCSGMAFTITYKVVGVASSSSLFYPTSSGCSQSSVSSPPNVCVLISNAFGTTLPENIQGASVATSPGTFTGLVCITSSATATSCPSSPPSLGPFTVGATFRVGVFVQGSQTLGGFDIYVASNPMFVRPTGANLGPLIPHPTSLNICVNNVSQTGTCTARTVNGPGVVEVTVINDDRSGKVCGGASPCSGMAFLINYTVVASTTSSALFYPTSSSGCANSSVSSPPDVCVLIADSVGNTLPENIQAATVTTTLTGLVCITFPSTSSSCPASAPMFGPFAAGSNFTVGVFIQGSQAMAGFDIYVAANYSLLHPTGAALGPLIASPSLTSICVNGVAVSGQCAVGTANGPGVVEVTTIDGRGVNECGNVSPCSGLAFTVTYSIVGASSGTPIFYPISSGCNPSSVSGTTTCVLVTNSVGATLPENIQGATVATTGSLPPNFSLVAASNSISVQSGKTASDTLTVTGIGNFTGSVGLANSPVPSGVTVTFTPNPVMINTRGGSATSSMTVFVPTSVAGGTSFTFTVTGTSGSLSHSVSIAVMVTSPPVIGLVCITSPSTATSCPSNPPLLGPFAPGSTFTVGVFIQGSEAMGGFDIYVRVNYTLLHPVSASLGTLIANPTLTSICINGVASVGSCTLNTANGPGVVEVTTIESTGTNECGGISPCSGLAFTITYSVVGSTFGTPIFYPSSAGCNPSSVFGTTTCVQVADDVGDILPENVQGATVATASDFSLAAVSSSLSIPAGSSASDTLTMTSLGGFTGSVALTNSSVPSGVAVIFVPDPVTISSPGGAATSSMNVFVGALAGTSFTFNVIATTGAITHSIAISVTVTAAPSFADGQVHWTHHVSLSKNNATQSWTATVANPLSTSVNVLVRIVGSSSINPSLTFDVTCGVTCVNTAGGVNNTRGLTSVSVAAGAKSFSFNFNQAISSGFANTKVTFTATLYWSTGSVYSPSSSKSGSFSVLP